MNFFYFSSKCWIFFFFFFSSRRRHTRFDCDWSSDVCSSDLLHRIEARRLDLDGRKPGRGRALDPALQAIEAPYRLVLRSIDLGVARGFGARAGERLRDRRELFPSPLGGGRAAGRSGRAGGGA